MAWCHKAASHYMNQYWSRYLLPYGNIGHNEWISPNFWSTLCQLMAKRRLVLGTLSDDPDQIQYICNPHLTVWFISALWRIHVSTNSSALQMSFASTFHWQGEVYRAYTDLERHEYQYIEFYFDSNFTELYFCGPKCLGKSLEPNFSTLFVNSSDRDIFDFTEISVERLNKMQHIYIIYIYIYIYILHIAVVQSVRLPPY